MFRRTFLAVSAILCPAISIAQRALDLNLEPSMPVKLIITFTPKPENRAEFETLLRMVRENLPKVEGCRNVEILRTLEGGDRFTLVETWESRSHHQKHIEGVIRSGDWGKIAAMLTNEPQGIYYTTF